MHQYTFPPSEYTRSLCVQIFHLLIPAFTYPPHAETLVSAWSLSDPCVSNFCSVPHLWEKRTTSGPFGWLFMASWAHLLVPFPAGLYFLTCLKLPAVPLTSTVVIFPNYSLLRLTMAELVFTKSHMSLCDSMNSMPGFPVLHYFPKFAQTHVHWVVDAIQPSHPLLSPFLLPSDFPRIKVFSSMAELAFP